MTWHPLYLMNHRLICDGFTWLEGYKSPCICVKDKIFRLVSKSFIRDSMYWLMDSLPISLLKGTILSKGLLDDQNQSSG